MESEGHEEHHLNQGLGLTLSFYDEGTVHDNFIARKGPQRDS